MIKAKITYEEHEPEVSEENMDDALESEEVSGNLNPAISKNAALQDDELTYYTIYEAFQFVKKNAGKLFKIIIKENSDSSIATNRRIVESSSLRNNSPEQNKLKIREIKKLGSYSTASKRSINQYESFDFPHKLAVNTNNGYDYIEIDDIIRMEADRSYCNIYLKNGSRILVSKCLNDFCKILEGSKFFRIHHSHLINLNHVKKYFRTEGGYVLLSDGSSVPLSRGKRVEFHDLMRNFAFIAD